MGCLAEPQPSAEGDSLRFLQDVMAIIVEHLQHRDLADSPIRPSISAADLGRILGCRGPAGAAPANDRDLLEICKLIVSHSVRTAHPNFVSQIYSKADLYGIAADIIVAALNNNVHVFQLAPALTLIEKDVLSYLSRRFGLDHPEGALSADGIFVPGGSYGNMAALYVAMAKRDPGIKTKGLAARQIPFAVFCSENAHYSLDKAAMLLGLGRDHLYRVPCDASGRMRVDLLRKAMRNAVEGGKEPLSIVATAGTTVLSAFDPLPDIAEVAQANGMWLHVDAAWGGAAAFSERHSALLKGADQADSLVFSAHKMLGAPIQCAALMVHSKHKGLLQDAASVDAPYLYQNTLDDPDAEPDLSRSTFQCGRRSDALKLWLMMQAQGTDGFQRRVDGCVAWATEFRSEIAQRQRKSGAFQIFQHMFTTVCFWYLPAALRGEDVEDLEPDTKAWHDLDKLPALVRDVLIRDEHRALLSYGNAQHVPSFFRLGISSSPQTPAQRKQSIAVVLDTLESVAEQIFVNQSAPNQNPGGPE